MSRQTAIIPFSMVMEPSSLGRGQKQYHRPRSAGAEYLHCKFSMWIPQIPPQTTSDVGNTHHWKSALCLPVSSLPQAEEAQMAPAPEHSPCWGLSPELESKEALFQPLAQTEPQVTPLLSCCSHVRSSTSSHTLLFLMHASGDSIPFQAVQRTN